MYDKIKMWLPRMSQHENITNHLTNIHVVKNLETGKEKIYGELNNLKIDIYECHWTIRGSLSGYIYPSNIYTLDRIGARTTIEKISDELHEDIHGANITGLEFGTNLIMEKKPKEYLELLYNSARCKRVPVGDTSVYFIKGDTRLIFYDKVEEMKNRGISLPPEFIGLNLLRYELRLYKHLKQHFKRDEVIASTLWEKNFYSCLMHMWEEEYNRIIKIPQLKIDYLKGINKVNEAFNALYSLLIIKSGPQIIYNYIEEVKKNNILKDSRNISRLKNKLNALLKDRIITNTSEDIRELNENINNIIHSV